MPNRLLCHYICCLLLAGLLILPGHAAADSLDLSKALVIGNGPKTVIEFTDPDCPYCRKAAAYFAKRKDVTSYIFFTPLAMHPQAKRKAQYILSHTNPMQAYHDVMSGRHDKVAVSTLPVTTKGVRQLEHQQRIAKSLKIDATPTFMLFGRIVEGFDLEKIQQLLGD
jgi:thiol:disulfide interchange protein DsbC